MRDVLMRGQVATAEDGFHIDQKQLRIQVRSDHRAETCKPTVLADAADRSFNY
jgi:hypothetical protein